MKAKISQQSQSEKADTSRQCASEKNDEVCIHAEDVKENEDLALSTRRMHGRPIKSLNMSLLCH